MEWVKISSTLFLIRGGKTLARIWFNTRSNRYQIATMLPDSEMTEHLFHSLESAKQATENSVKEWFKAVSI